MKGLEPEAEFRKLMVVMEAMKSFGVSQKVLIKKTYTNWSQNPVTTTVPGYLKVSTSRDSYLKKPTEAKS